MEYCVKGDHCFTKAGITNSSKRLVVTDVDDPFKALTETEEHTHLREIDQSIVQEELSTLLQPYLFPVIKVSLLKF